ncbi:unnamed protein product [Sympodiomycopsis kandeliae]
MPQKFRQRGKKKKNTEVANAAEPVVEHKDEQWQQQDFVPFDAAAEEQQHQQPGASEIQHTPIEYPDPSGVDTDVAPFGFVPPELKSYLKDAHANLQRLDTEAQEYAYQQYNNDQEDEEDQAGERNLLRLAMLREMDGQELACATDGECSVILEAIIAGLDHRRIRILADRASGSFSILASHRFGSHVLQAILTGLQQALTRSAKGKNKMAEDGSEGSSGVLRDAEQLICDIAKEMIPDAQSLVQATFATHVIRSLLLVLSGQDISQDVKSRSKKSAAFRNKAVGQDSSRHHSSSSKAIILRTFSPVLKDLREACVPQDTTGRNEARALLVSPSASPTFALLLSLEAQSGETNRPNSLADIVLEGMISDPTSTQSADGVETLLRHPSGSHALESILSYAPPDLADRFLSIYAKGKMTRLGSHPVANFVLAKTMKRASAEAVKEAIADVKESGGSKMVKDAKTSLFLAFLERSAKLQDKPLQESTVEVILESFGFEDSLKTIVADKESNVLVFQCILSLKTRHDFKKMIKRRKEKAASQAKEGTEEAQNGEQKKRKRADHDDNDGQSLREEEVTIQGSVLLQTLVKLDEPFNDLIFKSLLALPNPIPYTQHATTSHIYLHALSSPTSTFLQRRQLILSLLPHIPTLADHKYSSRISDLIFNRSDGFLKEKILKSLFDHENFLQSSFYGRFFLKRVNWIQYRKDAFAWKDKWVKTVQPDPFLPKLGHSDEEDTAEGGQAEEDVDAQSSRQEKKNKKQKQSQEQIELDNILSGL